jgi:serralysin
VIVGNSGDNIISGKGGVDTLTGNGGIDTFMFAAGETGATVGTRDLITDFQKGLDRIDLSNLVNQPLNFLGQQAFHGQGDAEVRFQFNGPNTALMVDINGDGTGDMVISLTGQVNLAASDFIL